MKVTNKNADKIALKLSNQLKGKIRFLDVFWDEVKIDNNGLNNSGWMGDAAKQNLPVKNFKTELAFNVCHNTFFIGIDESARVIFKKNGIIKIVQYNKERHDHKIEWLFQVVK